MEVIYDSQIETYKSVIGPIKRGMPIKVELHLPKEEITDNVVLKGIKMGDKSYEILCRIPKTEEKEEYNIYSIEGVMLHEIGTYEYYFFYTDNEGTEKYIRRYDHNTYEGGIHGKDDGVNWQTVIYDPIEQNKHLKGGIIYQIFPDRFFKGKIEESSLPRNRVYRKWGEVPFYDNDVGKDFFGGNFNGIVEKIPYLKELGVTAIYCNPVCLSSSNHRYNATNYLAFDPVLGNEEDFKYMIKKLHENDIIFILDGVFNHVGADSIYFDRYNEHYTKGAYVDPNSPYKDWFHFYENDSTKYESWWGFESLPRLMHRNSESLHEYLFGEKGVLKTWYSYGIDGLRLDVADELPNETLKDIYRVSKEAKGDDAIVLLEVWDDASNKWDYGHLMEFVYGHEATSIMNYPIRDTLMPYLRYGGDYAQKFNNACYEIFRENYPPEIVSGLMNFVSTHDTQRGITKLAGPEIGQNGRHWQFENNQLSPEEYEVGARLLKLAYLTLYFLPGCPSIYYGDEIGMQGMKDPFNRACFDWDNMNQDLLTDFINLGKIRHEYKDFLGDAKFDIIACLDRFLLFKRTKDEKSIYICFNSSNEYMDITEKVDQYINKVIYHLNDEENMYQEGKIILSPYDGLVFEG